jgi:phosphoribosylformylglycinamidine (FGAM) synthase PurS component
MPARVQVEPHAALARMGAGGVRNVRHGKHVELDVDGEPDEARIAEIAHTLLANPAIEEEVVDHDGQRGRRGRVRGAPRGP